MKLLIDDDIYVSPMIDGNISTSLGT